MEALNPKLVRLIVLMLAAAALLSGGFYAWRRYQNSQLEKEQTQAEARAASQAAAVTKHTTAYRLDSTRRATERAQLQREANLYHYQDEKLSTSRPADLDWPAEPPTER